MPLVTSILGYPRIGAQRELKRALESYWGSRTSQEELLATAAALRSHHWSIQRKAGIDISPCNDFSLYDTVLDTAVLVGAVPSRYRDLAPLEAYFAMARGAVEHKLAALPMKKWFDTNYHYIVPELEEHLNLSLNPAKLMDELSQAKTEGVKSRPVLLGPVTFLHLSQGSPLHRLPELLTVYAQLMELLAAEDVDWVQLDEPVLTLELTPELKEAYRKTLGFLRGISSRPKLMLTTYFGGLQENLELVVEQPLEGLHLDLNRAPEGLEGALEALPPQVVLSLGLIDGRNIWKADLDALKALLDKAAAARPASSLQLSTSCSLLHVPFDLELEHNLEPEISSWMSFARQKMDELVALSKHDAGAFRHSREVATTRRSSSRLNRPEVRRKLAAVTPEQLHRRSPFTQRKERQKARFSLPLLPTTTIGSFPQTTQVRKARADWKAGRLSSADYDEYLRREIKDCIERQEQLGLDVLVHGEFERNDMVEYFGEQLEGFVFTSNGWVQSYGSRCVKPPVLFGDVERKSPMTVEWTSYAQSLTKHPLKGMLTGPVTILQWSFVREDQPRRETCRQIASALRDEVVDLEKAGIGMIQVDEPAIREGLPLRRSDWAEYLAWAVECFRLCTSAVKDETQIHTHMCYSEFSDILEAVQAMDADALFIETSRSKMELLAQLDGYLNDIGPGIYDIHSPRVPSTEEMAENLRRALTRVPAQRLWVNPDCGLKTRSWEEVEGALRHLVEAAAKLRSEVATTPAR